MSASLTRRCPECGEEKPYSEFYFRRGKPGGYCKPCTKRTVLVWQQTRKEKEVGAAIAKARRAHSKWYRDLKRKDQEVPGTRICRKCLERKPKSDFYPTPKGLFSYCKSCTSLIEKSAHSESPFRRLETLLNACKTRSRNLHVGFDLTKDFLFSLWESQKGKCFYSGIPLTYAGDRSFSAISLDRVDPKKGYTQDNIVLACRRINEMKSNASKEEFFRLCTLVTQKFEEVSHGKDVHLESVHDARPGGSSRWSNWPSWSVSSKDALGELLEA